MLGQLAAGTVIAGYEIVRGLGRGGMGDVYLAQKVSGEQRHVALKLLSVGVAQDTRFKERFERESHMATSLEHPHIIPVYATGEVEGVRYIAMRYVNGPTLRDLIDRESPLDPRRSLSLLHQVASALDDAHDIDLVHRDVKPENVLISPGGVSEFREHAYLTDFGVSKYAGSESGFTKPGQFVGTPLYAAPEQIKELRIGHWTDIYAFGCVLFEALAGRVPFEKETNAALLWAHMNEDPPSLSTLRPELPADLDTVVEKAMSKEPEDRYASCGEVVRAAWAALGTSVQSPAKTTAAKPAVLEPPEASPVPRGPTVLKDGQPPLPVEPAGSACVDDRRQTECRARGRRKRRFLRRGARPRPSSDRWTGGSAEGACRAGLGNGSESGGRSDRDRWAQLSKWRDGDRREPAGVRASATAARVDARATRASSAETGSEGSETCRARGRRCGSACCRWRSRSGSCPRRRRRERGR